MKTKTFKINDKVWWYGIPGEIIALPIDNWGEYKVRLETGEIVYDDPETLTLKKRRKDENHS